MKKKDQNVRFRGLIPPALLLSCLLLLAGCGENAAAPTADGSSGGAAEMNASGMDLSFSARDMDVGYEESTAVQVALNGDSITVSGDGAAAEGGTLTISREGTYVLSGSLTDGQIIVSTGGTEKVQLVLNGVDIHCEEHAAIYVKQSDKVFLTLAAGTENRLSGGETVVLSEQDESNVDGVIFSKSDFTINGSGSLAVTAKYKHGVVSKDDLIITGGRLTVEAAGQALNGKDCVKIADGDFTLTSGGDAIQSDNTEDETRGFVYIRSGSFVINAGTDAIQAQTLLQIDGGGFQLTTGGGSANASMKSSGEAMPGWGSWGTASSDSGAGEETASAKGLKAGALVRVNGGSFTVDSSDDAVHSNGDVEISGGEFDVSSGDDGVHADAELTVSGGTLAISKCYEGLEGAAILISGGSVTLNAADDGLNAAGGNDGSALGGRPGQGSFATGTEYVIRITGGTLSVSASGDGIDSNGAVYIEGGAVTIDGPANDGNSALDYEQTAEISGGVFIGVGSGGMAQGFSDSSAQCSLTVTLDAAAEAGTEVVLTGSDGTVIASHTAQKSFRSVVISAPELVDGESYTLSAGSQTVELTLSGSVTASGSGGGMFGGGRGQGGFTPPDGTEPGGKQRQTQEGAGFDGPTPPDGTTTPSPPDETEKSAASK